MKFIASFAAIAIGLATILVAPALAERSPVFGRATIEAIPADVARDITARGDLANFYGAHAASYAYSAYVFAFYARYYAASNSWQEQNWYGAAAWYAYYAYVFSTWAQAYSQAGM